MGGVCISSVLQEVINSTACPCWEQYLNHCRTLIQFPASTLDGLPLVSPVLAGSQTLFWLPRAPTHMRYIHTDTYTEIKVLNHNSLKINKVLSRLCPIRSFFFAFNFLSLPSICVCIACFCSETCRLCRLTGLLVKWDFAKKWVCLNFHITRSFLIYVRPRRLLPRGDTLFFTVTQMVIPGFVVRVFDLGFSTEIVIPP